MPDAPIVWTPPAERVAASRFRAFERLIGRPAPGAPTEDTYEGVRRWALDHPGEFWAAVWRFTGVISDERPGREPWDAVVTGWDRMQPPGSDGPAWFTGARLNYAENLLRAPDDRVAIVWADESGTRGTLSRRELHRAVARCRRGLAALGVGPGDRVAGYLPNIPETVIAMLASASLGAVWSSCSMDFGVQGVLDRFGQVEPKVLVAADGYSYAGKRLSRLDELEAIAARLPTVERVVVVPWLDAGASVPGAMPWPDLLGADDAPALPFTRLPFDHPLFIMFSSGTTGLPKCMVHGAGGTLLQHLKEHALHVGLGPADRIFYYTTCGWMMWNWLVTALASEAALVLYDGAPMAPADDSLWALAARERVTVFGTSAKYLALSEKRGVRPLGRHDLAPLRTILSTGSPLAPEGFDYTYRSVKPDVQLASISGGTDLISCFALGNPVGPVRRGELQCRGLGMDVHVWDEAGQPVLDAPGDLVCTRPFPSMPTGFWNDPDGSRYRAAYFERYPGAWTHGDWAELRPGGGMVVLGRSDATLNPGGVRIGTAELYRVVEQVPGVLESVAVGQEVTVDGERDVRIVLFVRPREGAVVDDTLRDEVRRAVRQALSPHHVPRVIAEVPDIPRTVSGKISELAVRETIHGRPVRNTEALANPEALSHFRERAELAT